MNFYYTIRDRIQGRAPKGAKRSSQWRKVRRAHIELENSCQICARRKKLEVHHIIPFHIRPDLELNPNNLLTLCHRCHLCFGHLGDYQACNTTIEADVAHWGYRFANRRKAIEAS